MMDRPEHRGGAPVGFLHDLDPVEASAVIYLRMWFDGPDAQSLVWNDFATALGPRAGRKELQNFEQMCSLCAKHGRRPLVRHQVQCRCLGGDEATFANIVAHAAEGGTHFDHMLRAQGVRTLLFAGCNTNVCVQATASDAFYRGYYSIMVEDACASVTPEMNTNFIENHKKWFGDTTDIAALRAYWG